MRILLLGEYSGVHTNLSKALKRDGHEVCLVSDGDGYKSFKPDIYIKYEPLTSNLPVLKKLLSLYNLLLLYTGLAGCLQIFKHFKVIRSLKNYDIVQLINPVFLTNYGSIVNLLVFEYISKNNNNLYLCALGDDYQFVKYSLSNKSSHSIFDRLSLKTLKYYSRPLMYVYGFLYPTLNSRVLDKVDAIIPGLFDYYEAYKEHDKCTEIVPIIVESKVHKALNLEHYPVVIFHGWQKGRTLHKGNDIFHEAIIKLQEKNPEKIKYVIVSNLPYKEYINAFNNSHIFIDQCYSKDRGVNALLGMQSGKVVFSGFDRCVQDYYKVNKKPIINALPDAEKIYLELEDIISQPNLIRIYSERAISFIEEYHNAKYVLSKFYKIWGR